MTEISQALVHRYTRERTDANHVETHAVIEYLLSAPELTDGQSLSELVHQHQPDWVVENFASAVLSSVDDCMTLIFNITQMAPHVNAQLLRIQPRLAASILADPDAVLKAASPLLETLDLLSRGMVGWTEGLGAGSNKLQGVFDDAIEQLTARDTDIATLHDEVAKFMDKESDRIRRLEARLAASETGIVRSKQAKTLAADLINKKAQGKQITAPLGQFLKGPWYDSLQLLVNEKGLDSEAWQRASALTDTIIWTYQPIDEQAEDGAQNKQRLYRIIEHLPGEVKDLLVALEHNTDATEAALETLETDHVTIVSGQTPDFVDYEAIPSESAEVQSLVSKVLLRKVEDLTEGQWFSYAEGEQTQLIKLVLKLDDVQQLLFTNRNGMKVLQKSFDEFAYDLSSHVVRVINPDAAFSSTFKTYYQGMVEELRKHRQLINDRKAEVDRLDEERKQAQKKAQSEAARLAIAKEEAEQARAAALKAARLESARAEAEKLENADRVEEFTQIVASLASGAEVLLPDALGEKQVCKLAVKIAAADKFIFVDRDGMKAGDYQAEQLVQLLVAGEAELGESGVEFEDTLASVVSKLRSDREKSYDDLTSK